MGDIIVEELSVNKKPYSQLSYDLTKLLSRSDKKDNGIFFTSLKTIKKNINILEPYMENIKEVLEPSCGSCGYILELYKKYKINITGIEFNKTIYDSISHIQNDKIKLHNADYLKHTCAKTYGLIFGNPPYFVMNKKDVDGKYYKYFEGRPNIFILFIIKSLELLNDDGILSFVLPKSFLNCLYYNKTRKYIRDNFQILNITECDDDYIETKQETIIIVLQKLGYVKNDGGNYLSIGDFMIFGTYDNILKLNTLYTGSSTLNKLGFKVRVGTVVWNDCKDILSNDNEKTLLIYSSDITNKELKMKKYKNKDKKNYIDKEGSKEPLLVINRGYGSGTYSFSYCIINEKDDIKYLIENHLICVEYTKEISKDELVKLYKNIVKSFENKKTKEFIQVYFGNNAINTTELCNIIPIYDI